MRLIVAAFSEPPPMIAQLRRVAVAIPLDIGSSVVDLWLNGNIPRNCQTVNKKIQITSRCPAVNANTPRAHSMRRPLRADGQRIVCGYDVQYRRIASPTLPLANRRIRDNGTLTAR